MAYHLRVDHFEVPDFGFTSVFYKIEGKRSYLVSAYTSELFCLAGFGGFRSHLVCISRINWERMV